jgi:hypothetical protein
MKNLNLFCSLKLLLFVFALGSILNSCKKDEIIKEPNSVISSTVKNFIYSLKFDTTNIVDKGRYYIVEGDIMLEKDKLYLYGKSNANSSTLKQARSSDLVSLYNVHHITVRVDASIPTTSNADWRAAVQEAIGDWNQTGSQVHMTYTTSNTADITLMSDNGDLGNLEVALGSFPAASKPGSTILINLDFDSSAQVSPGPAAYFMIHELGHNIGLRHTNWSTYDSDPVGNPGIGIPGTPNDGVNPEPSSVMNQRLVVIQKVGFSSMDLLAIQTLYPYTYIPISLSGPINLTNFKSFDTFTYSVNFGYFSPTMCYWSISDSTGVTTLSGNGPSIVLVPIYNSSLQNGVNEVCTLKVFCSEISEEATLNISVKDGYQLSNSGGVPF